MVGLVPTRDVEHGGLLAALHDPEFRDGVLALLKKQRSRWVETHTLFKSVLISMTVSTIGLLFRGAMKSYREREEFLDVLRKVLDGNDDGA